jgi:hypothetical protein
VPVLAVVSVLPLLSELIVKLLEPLEFVVWLGKVLCVVFVAWL